MPRPERTEALQPDSGEVCLQLPLLVSQNLGHAALFQVFIGGKVSMLVHHCFFSLLCYPFAEKSDILFNQVCYKRQLKWADRQRKVAGR